MARNPKQDANLAPQFDSNQSREEARKNGAKGGRKSGEVRRARRDAKSAVRYLLGLAAEGKVAENLETLGFPANERTNMAALQARLFTLAIAGNLDAYMQLMKMGGYEPEENRKERESIASDRRRDAEVDAKLGALGAAPDNADMALNMKDEDGDTDVVVYVPKMQSEEECKVDEEESTEGESTQPKQ